MLTRIEWGKERNKRFPRSSCLSLLLHLPPRLPLTFLSACLFSFTHTSLSSIWFSFPFLTTNLLLLLPSSPLPRFHLPLSFYSSTSFIFLFSSSPFFFSVISGLYYPHTGSTQSERWGQTLCSEPHTVLFLCSPPFLVPPHPRQFLLFASKNVGVISVGCVCSICAFEFPWVFCKRGIHLCSPGSEFAERVVAAQPLRVLWRRLSWYRESQLSLGWVLTPTLVSYK